MLGTLNICKKLLIIVFCFRFHKKYIENAENHTHFDVIRAIIAFSVCYFIGKKCLNSSKQISFAALFLINIAFLISLGA